MKKGKNYYMPGSKLIGVDNQNSEKKLRPIEEILGDVKLIQQADSFNIDLTKEEEARMMEQFDLWLNDKSELEPYKNLELLGLDSLIVRVFNFEAERDMLGADGEKLKVSRVLPYVKVLRATPNSHIEEGAILCCSPRIANIKLSEAWRGWTMIKESQGVGAEGLIEPPKYEGLLLDWRKDSQFILDPRNPTKDDQYTFVKKLMNFSVIYKH